MIVRRMFADIEADIYLMADGDGTLTRLRAAAHRLRRKDMVDMAIGARAGLAHDAHRPATPIGNRLFNRLYQALFGAGFDDIFLGLPRFSRRFVKASPRSPSGFEIETGTFACTPAS